MIVLKTNFGIIKIELDTVGAPKTAEQFQQQVASGYYDGTIFHRVINDFMIQGGGFKSGMEKTPNVSPLDNEADTAASNTRGTVAMARTSDPHSAGSQFFINVKDNHFLDHQSKDVQGWGYCVFGRVTEGMDVVDKIKAVATTMRSGHQDVPVEDVIITKATVEQE